MFIWFIIDYIFLMRRLNAKPVVDDRSQKTVGCFKRGWYNV